MILDLDMGNTRIKWRLRSDSGNVARGHLPTAESWTGFAETIAAAKNKLEEDELRIEAIQYVRASSVQGPERDQAFNNWCHEQLSVMPQFASSAASVGGVSNGYLNPSLLGIDRWLAILSAFAQARQASVIVDCGSALTVDLVGGQGEHLGGYIAPGFALARRALLGSTHGVRVGDTPGELSLVPGRATEAGVAAAQGVMMVGLVRWAIQQLPPNPMLFITGGDGERLLPYFPEARWCPELVLDGLELALPVHS